MAASKAVMMVEHWAVSKAVKLVASSAEYWAGQMAECSVEN